MILGYFANQSYSFCFFVSFFLGGGVIQINIQNATLKGKSPIQINDLNVFFLRTCDLRILALFQSV